jgi:hypothetical protein
MPSSLRGRAADNWRHPLAIADAAGGVWPSLARQTAVTANVGRADETNGILLLQDVRTLFSDRKVDWLFSQEIVEALGAMEDRPWSEWKGGSPITPPQLARLLKPIKVEPKPARRSGHSPGKRGYDLSSFKDAFARYLPDASPESATAQQPSKSAISAACE